ncbi:MAG: nucleotide pyrophosphohydrolase [Phycisphaerae bacterium]
MANGLEGCSVKDSNTTVETLKNLVEAFVDERDWHPFHDPKNLSMSIAIEAGELMEHFQWLRSEELPAVRQDPEKMAEIEEELADIAAYVLSFATTMKIDLASALRDKMRKNALKYPAGEFRGRSG